MLKWFAVLSVALGIFSIVTTEILPIGLLTSVAAEFGVSDGTAGLTMTVPGLVAAVAAPVFTVVTARLDRRSMLGVLMAVLIVADLMAAFAPAYWLVLVSRVLVGVVIGGFWSIGAGLAGRLVHDRAVPVATAAIFAAVPLGSVVGVPAGTWIGHQAGWRASFVVMGVFTIVVLVALLALVPRLPAEQVTSLRVLGALLRGSAVRAGLVVTFLIVVAHFATYTYITPFLERVTHLSPGLVGTFLLLYGAAGIAGNFLAGATIRRFFAATFCAAALLIAAATLLLPLLGTTPVGAAVLLVLWGVGYGAVPACSQTWFARAAPGAAEAGTVLFVSSFQVSLSAGALAGGVVADAASPSTLMLYGGAVALAVVWLTGSGRSSLSRRGSRPGGVLPRPPRAGG